ncbi:MAG TPA: hypothetical protein VF717_03010 [Pyrinomonadaceae bacterium]|jgi:hypothetical protein
MKEIRGMEAVRYAEEQGIFFDADEDYMLRAESALLGSPATLNDIDNLFAERLGTGYDPTDLFPDGENFELLVERYGDRWIYVPLGGNHPEEEERVVMRLFRGFLKEEEPFCGGDILDLAATYNPRLRNTGFPKGANSNLIFHAALRLVEKGELEAVWDRRPLPKAATRSYGNRRFYVEADMEISLSGVLCDSCSGEFVGSSASLHLECLRWLRKALAKAERA